MAIRKERKPVVRYSRHNLPVGRPEVNVGPSKVIEAGDTSTGAVVSRITNGDYGFPRDLNEKAKLFDAPEVSDIPVQRRKGANIVDVANAIKVERIETAIAKDINSRKPVVKSSPSGEAKEPKVPLDPSVDPSKGS